jgi:hypothetical protein
MSVQGSGRVGLTGGCQCGAVRYRVEAKPTGTSVCHCRMCQKAGGAPFMAFADVLTETFVVTRGALATFRSSQIAFCAACGTPLTYRQLDGGHTEVTLGSFDDPNAVAPIAQYSVESRVRWLAEALTAPATRIDEWLAGKKIAPVGARLHPDHET